jgi:hypothetical protein
LYSNFRCEEGVNILSSYPSNYNDLYDKAFNEIKSIFYREAIISNPVAQRSIIHEGFPASQLTAEDKIAQLTGVEIARNFNKKPERIPLLRGFVCKNDSRIYLNQDNWCIKTVYHEMFHLCSNSCSPDSSMRAACMKHRPLYEGLTELYAGYMLDKSYPKSYHNCWLGQGGQLCRMTYKEEASLWATFCNSVPLSTTFDIYFHQPSKDWNVISHDFQSRVRLLGFNDFLSPFDDSETSDTDRLREECIKIMGLDDFESRLKKNKTSLDFNQISY